MKNVKNNHDAPLSVAGVLIGAGATVGIEEDALRGCMNSNAIRQWVKLGIIEIEGLPEGSEIINTPDGPEVKIPEVKIPGMDDKTPERLALESQAAALKITGNIARMKDETLVKKIAEVEESS